MLRNRTLSVLKARVISISISQWIFSFFQLVCALISIAWLFVYPPSSGYAISLMAFAAAMMTVHSGMNRFQKAIWLVLICILLPTEFRAIKQDRQTASIEALQERAVQEAHFSDVRKGQEQDFQNITEGFKRTLVQNEHEFRATQIALEKNLWAAKTTQTQTQPHALLHVDRVITEPKQTSIVFHAYVVNDGSEAASKVSYLTKGYVTDSLDHGTENEIAQRFESDWTLGSHMLKAPFPLHENTALPNDTEPITTKEITDLLAGKKALYYITRLTYSDSTGNWVSDHCSVLIVGQGLPHACVMLNEQRYKISVNQR